MSAIRDTAGGATGTGTKSVGPPVSITAPDGARVIFVRDAFGRITEATDALGGTLRQGWTVEDEPAWWELPDGTREEWPGTVRATWSATRPSGPYQHTRCHSRARRTRRRSYPISAEA
ncbi:RHS repeat domain-containing protein [Streptomyces sp. NPDC051896]|uniref:RHS repeat domain-containing protein n=1 Tax=Streptomyces sp. NPDC051896 TaxID=3155416 RepID=UPI00341F3764